MRKTGLRDVSIGFLVLCLFVSAMTIQVSAEDEYNLKDSFPSPDPVSSGMFGWSVAISGDILVVGGLQSIANDRPAGEAYIYDSDGNLLATIQSPEPKASFSYSVAVSGDTVVVGEWANMVEGVSAAGRAYIFDSDGNLRSTLLSPEPRNQAQFGWSVAVSGDTIVVSEPKNIVEEKLGAGRAYIFDSNGNLESTLLSPRPGWNAFFGCSVAADGDKIVVGEVYVAERATPVGPGSVYVFDSEGNHLATLQSPEPTNTNFGWSVAINEDIIVVGESFADVDGNSKAGRVYIFDTDGNLLTTLQAPTPEENAEFGNAVAIGGDIVVVGEYKADVESLNEGRAYVFDLDGTLLATHQSPIPGAAAYFGNSVAVNGDTIAVGEPNAKVDGILKAGKVHIYAPGPPVEEPATVEEPVETSSGSNTQPEKKGIPGFPYESILLGVVSAILVLWSIQRKR